MKHLQLERDKLAAEATGATHGSPICRACGKETLAHSVDASGGKHYAPICATCEDEIEDRGAAQMRDRCLAVLDQEGWLGNAYQRIRALPARETGQTRQSVLDTRSPRR